jgi:hypothetical protein
MNSLYTRTRLTGINQSHEMFESVYFLCLGSAHAWRRMIVVEWLFQLSYFISLLKFEDFQLAISCFV